MVKRITGKLELSLQEQPVGEIEFKNGQAVLNVKTFKAAFGLYRLMKTSSMHQKMLRNVFLGSQKFSLPVYLKIGKFVKVRLSQNNFLLSRIIGLLLLDYYKIRAN